MKKVSVVMSVYNNQHYLEKAIRSILNQTLSDFEFIIIDDYSTDNSKKILMKYAKNDKRIKVITNRENIGLTKSLNIGLKIARAKYVARMDSDDISLPRRLEDQYNYLENYKNIFLVGSGALIINNEGKIVKKFKPIVGVKKIKEGLFKKNVIYHPTIMFRNHKSCFYREKFIYAQDYDFYLNLISSGEHLNNIFRPLIKYRINNQGITWKEKSKQKLFANKARDFYHQRLSKEIDEYETFNPIEILNLDANNSTNRIVLESEIKVSFKFNDFERVKKLSRKFFTHHGLINKISLYFIASLMGERIINFLKKF